MTSGSFRYIANPMGCSNSYGPYNLGREFCYVAYLERCFNGSEVNETPWRFKEGKKGPV